MSLTPSWRKLFLMTQGHEPSFTYTPDSICEGYPGVVSSAFEVGSVGFH